VVGLIWLLLALFVAYPLVMLGARAIFEDGVLDLAPAVRTLLSASTARAFFNSLLLATLVGVLGTALGFLFAFTVARARIGRAMAGLLDSATLLPLISPPFTTSIAFVFSFGPRGFITYDLLGMQGAQVYGLRSTTVAEALTYFPLAYMALRPMLAAIGTNLEEMAFSLGSSRWRAFRTVTLKLTTPGLANAFLLVFAASLADFATPLILAGNDLPVLPTDAFLQITGMFDLKGGAVLSLLLLVPSLIVFLLQRWMVSRRSFVTLSGKGVRAGMGDGVTPGLRRVLVVACLLAVAFILYLYGLLLYASLVRAFGADATPTLLNYRIVFTQGLPAIRDTLIIGAIAMPLGGLYGVVVGSLVGRVRGGQALELVSMINYALPGTVVGIGYLVAFNQPPFLLTGTAAIIVACYIFRYSPSGIRTTIALLAQIDKSIEEASTSLGAGTATTFRRIILPLIMPAFFAGLSVVFIRSMTAISATIFLVSIHWTLITVRILENMTELMLGPAAAFSIFVIVVVLAVTKGLELLLRRLGGRSADLMTIGRE
jgi:iron(III) transport system permease protein